MLRRPWAVVSAYTHWMASDRSFLSGKKLDKLARVIGIRPTSINYQSIATVLMHANRFMLRRVLTLCHLIHSIKWLLILEETVWGYVPYLYIAVTYTSRMFKYVVCGYVAPSFFSYFRISATKRDTL